MKDSQPNYPSYGSSGIRLYSKERITLKPYKFKVVDTGVKLSIPSNCCGLVLGDSKLFEVGIMTHTVVLDSDYDSTVKFHLRNITNNTFQINKDFILGQVVVLDITKLGSIKTINSQRHEDYRRV